MTTMAHLEHSAGWLTGLAGWLSGWLGWLGCLAACVAGPEGLFDKPDQFSSIQLFKMTTIL